MRTRTLATLVVTLSAATFAFAQSAEPTKKSGCCAEGAKATANASGCCASGATASADKNGTCEKVELVRKSIPAINYRVGDETVCCPKQAGEMAKAKNTKIQFVVAEKTYADEVEAKKAYAKVLDGYMTEMVSVKYAVGDECVACPVTAKSLAQKEKKPMTYRVAAYDFKTEEAAKKAVVAAKEAVSKVEMKTMVGDKQYSCCDSAAAAAKVAGKPVEYKIGEKATCCPVEADVNLALAKIEAAISALAQASNS